MLGDEVPARAPFNDRAVRAVFIGVVSALLIVARNPTNLLTSTETAFDT
jgi:hypothetical protein